MCAYMHDGEPYLSVVFAEKPAGASSVRFATLGEQSQEAWETNTGKRWVTAMVTAVAG